MKVNVIGTACTWFERKNTSYLIDDKIVFDTPSGSYKDVIKITDIEKISTILISHFHSDHFADIHVYATRFMRELKTPSEKKKIYAPKGALENLIKLNDAMQSACDELVAENFLKNIDFIDLYDGLKFEVEGYNVTAYQMKHGKPETYGFVFEDKNGQTIGFSADTEMCDNLKTIISRSDFAFIEMASVTKREKHLCIDEFESLEKEFPSCKMFPVHTCDKCQKYAEDNNMNYLHDGQILEF